MRFKFGLQKISIVLILFMASTLTLVFNIPPVKASGTIYIRTDGSVFPSTANITSVNNVTYVFTDNNYDEIVVERDNIILDGVGYALQGNGSGTGIYLSGRSNVTIKNMGIKAFKHGIWLGYSSSNGVSGNNITNNNDEGIWLWRSYNNSISGNNITNNGRGVLLDESSKNILSGNVMNGNRYNFEVRGIELGHFMHSIDVSNFVDGKSVYYLVNQRDLVINSAVHPQVGYLALVNCSHVTMENLTLTNNGQGLLLAYTNNSRVTDNNITSNWYGILFWHSSNNSIVGSNIASNKYYGVSLRDSSNDNSMVGNNIARNWEGILLEDSSNNSIVGNNITANNEYGIDLYHSSNYNRIVRNNIIDNGQSMRVDSSSNNSILENNITGNSYGTYIVYSSNNTFSGNNIASNGHGIFLSYSSNNSVVGNNIASNGYGGIYLYESSNYNRIVRNNITANNECGIQVWYSSNNSMVANNIANNEYGIYLLHSSNNSMVGNNITANNVDGIVLYDSSNNNMVANNITANNDYGIYLYESSNHNRIVGNNVANNEYGISLWYSSKYNRIVRNNITANSIYGILLSDSSNNSIVENNITANNEYGILLFTSSNNSIYHNNFINPVEQASVWGLSYNKWDDGYPSGGNFWSNYNGADLYHGPYQNETGSDRIGDTSYVIDAINVDNYPLMSPWSPHDVAVADIILSKTVLGVGYFMDIDVFVKNKGDYTESFNVTLLYDNNTIGTRTLTNVAPKTLTKITFNWNTTGVPKGTHTITAKASIVPGETVIIDNTYIDGTVWVSIPGDITGYPIPSPPDGKVWTEDLYLFGKAWGSKIGDPRYNPLVDFTGYPIPSPPDGFVRVEDLWVLGKNWGKTW